MPDKPDVEDWMADESEMDQVLPAPTKPTGTQIKLPILLNPQYYPRANVLEHELKVREVIQRIPQGPHPERAAVCLQVFEELLPKISAVFQPTFQLILKELDTSVYAEHYTSYSNHDKSRIHRVPYFVLANRSSEKRDVEMMRLKDNLTDLEQKLKFRERDINVLVKKNLNLRNQVETMESEIKQLKEHNETLQAESKRYQAKRDEIKASYDVILDQVKSECNSLQTKLEHAQRTVQKLSSVKGGYSDMEAKMAMNSLLQTNVVKKTLKGTAAAFLRTDIDSMSKLKSQLGAIIIEQMEEYENNLWEVTQKYFIMQSNAARSGGQNTKSTTQNHQLIQEQSTVLKGFKKRVQQCLDEYNLLAEMEKHTTLAQEKWSAKNKEVVRNTDAFRRDAVQLTYSVDAGKTYELYRNSPYCTSCNVPSMVLCPHQVECTYEISLWDGSRNTREHFQANAWTNIRFERPSLTYTIPENVFDVESGPITALIPTLPKPTESEPEKETFEFEYLDRSVPRRIRSIWRDFYVVRGGKKPTSPRTITLEKLLWFIDEFNRVRVMLEEVYVENFDSQGRLDDPQSELGKRREALGFYRDMEFKENMLDCFYSFIKVRYPFQDLYTQVVYEIFLAIQQHEKDNRNVRIFVRQLYGDSEINWKYMLYMKELLAQFEPLDLSNYRKMIHLLFPYRSAPEFYEQLELDDISYTRNHLTVEAFYERLQRVLLQHREPNIMAFQILITRDMITSYPDATTINVMQLVSTMHRYLPPCPSDLLKRRWDICLKNMPKKEMQASKTLPLHRAASIAAYCLFWCIKRWGNSVSVPAIATDGDQLVTVLQLGDHTKMKILYDGTESTLEYMEKEEAFLKKSLPDDVGDILDIPETEGDDATEFQVPEDENNSNTSPEVADDQSQASSDATRRSRPRRKTSLSRKKSVAHHQTQREPIQSNIKEEKSE